MKRKSWTNDPDVVAAWNATTEAMIIRSGASRPLDEAEPIIHRLYEAAGLPAPRVVMVPSPMTGAIVWALATAYMECRAAPDAATRDATDAATIDATGAATFAATRAATYNATRDATDAATFTATRDATRDATDAATYAATHAATDAATRDATDAATYAATRAATRDATDAATYAATDAATRDATFTATRAATDAATRDATHAATYAATRAATYNATCDATDAATRDATRAATRDATHNATHNATIDAISNVPVVGRGYLARIASDLWGGHGDAIARMAAILVTQWSGAYNGGNEWASWSRFLAYCRDVGGLTLPVHARFRAYEEALTLGPRFMSPRLCLVCDLPTRRRTTMIDGRHLLHCVDGPALEYSDGHRYWWIRGVRLPDGEAGERIVMRPDQQTAEEIDAERSEEVRAIRIERMGWPEYLRRSGAKVLDEGPNYIEGTYEALMQSRRGDLRLVCTCPTGRIFALGVPPDVTTCEQARNWLAGEKPFRVLART